MAIDPRISLAGIVPQTQSGQTVSNIFQTNLNNAQNRRINEQQAQQQAALQPFRETLLANQAGLSTAQQPALLQQAALAASPEQQQVSFDEISTTIRTTAAQRLKPFLDANDVAGANAELDTAINTLTQKGVDQSLIEPLIRAKQSLQTPEGVAQLKQSTDSFLTPQGSSAIQSSQFIPGKGFATITKSGEAGFQAIEGVGETIEEKRVADIAGRASTEQLKATLSGKSSAIKAAVNKGAKAFDKIQTITTAISNYDEAISLLGPDGAETGVIDSLLPSFRTASIELDNVVKRLGLDVVGNTTFGALSESELKFALQAAIPTNLQPAELKEWLIAKRDAQKKVKERVEEAASFLSTGTHTLTDWIAFDQAKQLNIKNKQEQATAPQVAPTPQPTSDGVDLSTLSIEDLIAERNRLGGQ